MRNARRNCESRDSMSEIGIPAIRVPRGQAPVATAGFGGAGRETGSTCRQFVHCKACGGGPHADRRVARSLPARSECKSTRCRIARRLWRLRGPDPRPRRRRPSVRRTAGSRSGSRSRRVEPASAKSRRSKRMSASTPAWRACLRDMARLGSSMSLPTMASRPSRTARSLRLLPGLVPESADRASANRRPQTGGPVRALDCEPKGPPRWGSCPSRKMGRGADAPPSNS